MTLRGSYLAGIGVLVLIQVLLAFGVIGLLTRMSPAVQEILAENVYSNEAAEDVMAALALAIAGIEGDHRERFDDALARARHNVTEDEEVPVIEALERHGDRVLRGESAALPLALEAAEHLIEINRSAMERANERAQRLGTTGAWTAVVLGLTGFLVSVLVVRRTIFGVVEPVEELEAVLRSFREGDRYRRCQGRAASQEMRHVLGAVNTLLDRVHRVVDEKLDSSDD